MTKALHDLPVLYIQKSAPASAEVETFLSSHGIPFRLKEIEDASDRSFPGTRLPLLDWHGDVHEGGNLDSLVAFLHRHEVELEDS